MLLGMILAQVWPGHQKGRCPSGKLTSAFGDDGPSKNRGLRLSSLGNPMHRDSRAQIRDERHPCVRNHEFLSLLIDCGKAEGEARSPDSCPPRESETRREARPLDCFVRHRLHADRYGSPEFRHP